jgi:sugar phosphate isomerase/epimerase
MKLAYSTNAYKKTTLEAAIDSIAKLGYAGVEIMADVPHAYPPEMSAERTAAVRRQIEAAGLAISNINAFTLFATGDTYHPTWIENDLRQVARRIEHTRNVIHMAAGLGAKTISLQPGGPVGKTPRDVALRRYEAGLMEVLPLAEEAGITLMVEPEPGLIIQRADECVEFLERVNHPHLKMNADLGHFYCVGEDPAAVVRQYAKHIAHVHVEDIGDNRVHQHLVPGEGAMDFAAIFEALRAVDYPGWVTVELYPYVSSAEESGRQAMEFLRPLM